MDNMTHFKDFFDPASGNWEQRLATVVEIMLEMSRQTDPQAMVRAYLARIRDLIPGDRRISLSRRGVEPPRCRITRCSLWTEEINPWRDKDRLPVLEGGLLSDLIHGDKPRIIDDLQVDIDDPGAEYLAGQRSLIASPIYDRGAGLNMVVVTRCEPAAFSRERCPDWVMVLQHGETKKFEPFDRYAMYEDSKDKTIEHLLETFAVLRTANLETLRAMNLTPEKLALRGTHPKLGSVTMQELLAMWVVHDLNHFHQIAKCMAWQYKDAIGPWLPYVGMLKPEST